MVNVEIRSGNRLDPETVTIVAGPFPSWADVVDYANTDPLMVGDKPQYISHTDMAGLETWLDMKGLHTFSSY